MVENLNANNGHSYFIGVDGSEQSDLAFDVVMHGLFRSTKDTFNVCHITDSKKDYLPFCHTPEYLEAKYQGKIWVWSNDNKAKFIKKEVENEKTTKETLWNQAQLNKASIIVTGMHGRKGPKADLTVAGTAVQFLYQGEKLPLVVVKDPRRRGEGLKGSYRFGVCFDGSSASQKCLKVVLSMMADHDKLVVITCQEPNLNN